MDSLITGSLTLQGFPLSPSKFNPKTSLSFFRSNLHFPSNPQSRFNIRASSSSFNVEPGKTPVLRKIKSTAGTLIITVATALMIGKLSKLPARAETPVPLVEEQKQQDLQQQQESKGIKEEIGELVLKKFLDSQSKDIDELKSRGKEKLESTKDKKALKLLVSDQLALIQGKLLLAKLTKEYGESFGVGKVLEKILKESLISFDALFQNALLMDQIGEVEALTDKLEEALLFYMKEMDPKDDHRDIMFVFAQCLFLKKKTEKALKIYQDLAKEDPKDYRSYFCQGVIYTLLGRNEEAKEQFEMGSKISPKEFEVEGFLQCLLGEKLKGGKSL